LNAERVNELVSYLLAQDRRLKIQDRVIAVRDALQSLQNNPSDPSSQQLAAEALGELDVAMLTFDREVTPARAEAVREIRGRRWFSQDLAESFRQALNDNAATPAVAAELVRAEADERNTYLERLRSTTAALTGLGLEPAEPEEGNPELGFTIPRELFGNQLSGLSKELGEISRILDIFSEATTNEKQPVEVKQISTSDPVFFFQVVTPVAVAVAGSITWLLNTWKQALEIKDLRTKAKVAGFDDDELKVFEDKVDRLVTQSINQRVDEIVGERRDARANELRNGLSYAHRALLARIERGMTVEVRFLPPQGDEEEADQPGEAEARAAYATLAAYAQKMEFPEITEEPILKLPRYEELKQNPKPSKA